MDIIIVGNGKMGFSLADQLASEDHSITIVDTHEAALRRASDTLDVMSVKGNGVSAAVLREAGAEHADLLIAATSTDEVNMVCCLTAKKMGTSYTIARIRNQEYTSGLAELKRDLGIDMVINPENATAVEISRLLRIHCHDFRRVHNGAASQCDNEIAAFLLGKMSSFLDDLLDRIRSDLIKQHNLHTCEGKLFHRTVKCAARSGRFPI